MHDTEYLTPRTWSSIQSRRWANRVTNSFALTCVLSSRQFHATSFPPKWVCLATNPFALISVLSSRQFHATSFPPKWVCLATNPFALISVLSSRQFHATSFPPKWVCLATNPFALISVLSSRQFHATSFPPKWVCLATNPFALISVLSSRQFHATSFPPKWVCLATNPFALTCVLSSRRFYEKCALMTISEEICFFVIQSSLIVCSMIEVRMRGNCRDSLGWRYPIHDLKPWNLWAPGDFSCIATLLKIRFIRWRVQRSCWVRVVGFMNELCFALSCIAIPKKSYMTRIMFVIHYNDFRTSLNENAILFHEIKCITQN